MITCPNCGTQNEPGARFCAECGADLRSVSSPQPPPRTGSIPPQYVPGTPPGQPTTWSSNQPPPPERKRRVWLWIVVGVLAACVLLCCALTVFASTDRGEEFFGDIGTRLADELTEVAPTPTRRP